MHVNLTVLKHMTGLKARVRTSVAAAAVLAITIGGAATAQAQSGRAELGAPPPGTR